MSVPTIEPFAEVDVGPLAAWLEGLPVEDWPRTADPAFRGVAGFLRPLADRLMEFFPGCLRSEPGLFLLAAGQQHPAHTDTQPSEWVTRVHLPVLTNPKATATTAEGTLHMLAGTAYRFNTRLSHAVANDGTTPRFHMVFDTFQGDLP